MIPVAIAQIIARIASSKAGQIAIAIFGATIAIGIAVLKVFNSGKAAERTRQDQQSLENLRSRNETDNEIRDLSDDALRQRADRWVRPDDDGR